MRAIASRLEADVHERGGEEEDIQLVRAALATADTVQMLHGESLGQIHIDSIFRRYVRFVQAFRVVLGDRLDWRATKRAIKPDHSLEKVPRRTAPTKRASGTK